MLQQMFEVMSTRFHAAMKMFVQLIDSVVDRYRWNPWKRRRLPGNAHLVPTDLSTLEKKVKIILHDISKDLPCK